MKILDRGFRIVVVAALSLFLFSVILYSQEEKNIDAESQQKEAVSGPVTTANTETPQVVKNKTEVNPDLIEKSIPSYNTHLKEILKAAEENIKKVDKEIAQIEVRARNAQREAKVREAFESGNELYKAGNLKEAKEAWQKAVSISKDPEMKIYIEEASRRAGEEVRKLEAEQKEKARIKREAEKKAETEAREAARKAEIEARDRAREKARPERETAEKAEAAARQMPRQDREDAKMAEAELREKGEAALLEKEAAKVQNMNVAAFGKNLEGLYEEAVGYYKNGDIDKAKSAFAKIVRLYPNQTTAQRYLDEEIPEEMEKLSGRR